jgi:hypothetical protein
VEDLEVIDAFVNGGAERAFGSGLHIETNALMVDGWWHACMRVSPDVFTVRNEPPPRDTTILDDIAAALLAKGLVNVGSDLPEITFITYTTLSLGYVSWNLWATDLAAGTAALSAKVTEDSFLENKTYYEPHREVDYTAELGGARRTAGLPPSVVLTVGLPADVVAPLEQELRDCRVESRAFGQISPDGCGAMIPSLILIDASEQQGKEFCMQFRAAACGRFIPVLAVTPDAVPPLGADAAVSPTEGPHGWVEPIRNLLP